VTAEPEAVPPVVSLVSLGCAKNTVDSERLLGLLVRAGFLIAEDPADADLCLVNTCGFIEEARREAADVLARLARLRRRGRLRTVAAMGCLVERAAGAPETGSFLDDADARIPFRDYLRLPEICRALIAGGGASGEAAPAGAGRAARIEDRFHLQPRLVTGAGHSAWLKIAEGCSNCCRYCAIPAIRGPQASRPLSDIVTEARQLTTAGAVELNLIAQDTANYGRDRAGAPRLPELLRAVADAVPERTWLRLLYAHPRHLTDEILKTLASDPRFCPYLDVPLQHVATRMLAAMGRGMDGAATRRRLDRIAARWPACALRTTFIAGFPGETERDFGELLDFVREGRFLHAGVFVFSPEPGTPAAALGGRVPAAVASARRAALLEAQRAVSRRRLRAWVGRDLDVMIDSADGRSARAAWQAPDADGTVRVEGARDAAPGRFLRVRVTGSGDYDLFSACL